MQKIFSLPKFSEKDFFVAGKFLFFLAVSFAVLNFFSSLVPLEWIETVFAVPTAIALGLLGFHSTIQAGEPVMLFFDGLMIPIAISYLCTGLLEWTVLCSAIFSTTEIGARKRVIGAIGATAAIFAFNLFRIIASILLIFFLGLQAAAFSHDIFFRLFLFVTIAGFYFVWIKAAQGKQLT